MGYEYRLRFRYDSRTEVEALLKNQTAFYAFDQSYDLFCFGRPEKKDSMPLAFAKVEETGIYFCDNGFAQNILNDLESAVTKAFGKPELDDDI